MLELFFLSLLFFPLMLEFAEKISSASRVSSPETQLKFEKLINKKIGREKLVSN